MVGKWQAQPTLRCILTFGLQLCTIKPLRTFQAQIVRVLYFLELY
jgi:hypothetical protein